MAKLFQQIFLIFTILFVFAVSTQAQQDKNCPPNQEWVSCGSSCPRKCGQRDPLICTYQCKVGCQCKSGYVLHSNGQCVLTRDC